MNEAEEQTILEMCDDDVALSGAAFGQFLSQHALPLLHCIKSLLTARGIHYNVEGMAEEILQELAVQLLRRARDDSLLDVRSLPEYVYGAAKKCALNSLRKGASRSEQIPSSETFWEETDRILTHDGLRPSELKEIEDAIFGCIEELPGLQKDYIRIIAANYNSPPSPGEIADLHGVSPEPVRNRLFEARKRLGECLKKKGHQIPKKASGEPK